MRKFEWKPGWTEVRERKVAPSKCSKGQFRRRNVSGRTGTDAIYCCPKGYHFDTRGRRGCVRGNATTTPIVQALRHDKKKFAKRNPKVWKKLSQGTGTKKRTVKVQ